MFPLMTALPVLFSSGGGSSPSPTPGSDFYDYILADSLKFDSSDSSYLSRTPSTQGNRRTWTWSAWVKRSTLGTSQYLLAAGTWGGSNSSAGIAFIGDQLLFQTFETGTATIGSQTDAVFRDNSAWYHVVIKFDSTQSTASDRLVIYVNGVAQDRSLRSGYTNNDPSLNDEPLFNFTAAHQIGAIGTPANYFDGYMAEINFVDGTALDASSFGEVKEGIWIAKEYTGSYGTNGYHLDFADSSSIGNDASDNSNNWTATNLAAADVFVDSPTNNFATLNPLKLSTNVGTYANNNLRFTTAVANPSHALSTQAVSSGKWYVEVRCTSGTSHVHSMGVVVSNVSETQNLYASGSQAYLYFGNGFYYQSGAGAAYGASFANGDIIGIALDMDNGTLEFYKNGTSQGIADSENIAGKELFFVSNDGSGSSNVTQDINFGQNPTFNGTATGGANDSDSNGYGEFYYTPPSGFLALCTANYPTLDIEPAEGDNPQDHFNTVIWTGNETNNRSITGVGFQADFTWIKMRSGFTTSDHAVFDSVRGVNKPLHANLNNAEEAQSDHGGVGSWSADSFTLVEGDVGLAEGKLFEVNDGSATYVGWNWKGGGTAASNTDGSITSNVSTNADAGFSIVSYTGNGTSGTTVGHGLNASPDFIITKSRSSDVGHWAVYASVLGSDKVLNLNNTIAATDEGNIWWPSDPTNTVFSIGTGNDVNNSGTTYIAYCFNEVKGYSKFGSYTGNGSSDGAFVYTGFRPAFVIIKRTDATANWGMFDSKRNGYNINNDILYPNLNNAEENAEWIDLTSNGFKLRFNHAQINATNGTYIYMAFAEQPFKYANAR